MFICGWPCIKRQMYQGNEPYKSITISGLTRAIQYHFKIIHVRVVISAGCLASSMWDALGPDGRCETSVGYDRPLHFHPHVHIYIFTLLSHCHNIDFILSVVWHHDTHLNICNMIIKWFPDEFLISWFPTWTKTQFYTPGNFKTLEEMCRFKGIKC